MGLDKLKYLTTILKLLCFSRLIIPTYYDTLTFEGMWGQRYQINDLL